MRAGISWNNPDNNLERPAYWQSNSASIRDGEADVLTIAATSTDHVRFRKTRAPRPATCSGMTFENDEARNRVARYALRVADGEN